MFRNVKVYFIAMIILLFGGSVYNSKAEQFSVIWHNDWWYYDWIGNYYHGYGLVATDDGKYLAVMWNNTIGNYVSVDSGGIGYVYYFRGSDAGAPFFEISNGSIRAYYYGWCSIGDWINLNGSGFSTVFCYGDSDFWAYGIDVSNGRVRFCVDNWWWDSYGWNCGDWITLHPCPSGYAYNSSTGKCEATPTYSCPSGYSYNPSTRKCEMSAQIVYACPLGPYPCINTGSNYYCSPYQCVDIENSSNVQTFDTAEGANDKHDDGPRDSATGKCNGIVRIFNGQDLRCRPPGIDTFWTLDCCKKDKNFIFRCNNSSEQMLAKLRTTIKYRGQDRDYTAADANCHYVGSYCSKKIKFIGCVQKKKTYCCFHSPLARIVQEQGRPQLGKGWGDPKSPDCSGFTIDEFQKLDFSKIDFSEWINMIVGEETANLRNNLPGQAQDMQGKIQRMYQ